MSRGASDAVQLSSSTGKAFDGTSLVLSELEFMFVFRAGNRVGDRADIIVFMMLLFVVEVEKKLEL